MTDRQVAMPFVHAPNAGAAHSRKVLRRRAREDAPRIVRRCAKCGRQLPPSMRIDARTCSQSCRQKLARTIAKAKRVRAKRTQPSLASKTTRRRRLLSSSAIDRVRIDVDAMGTLSSAGPASSPTFATADASTGGTMD